MDANDTFQIDGKLICEEHPPLVISIYCPLCEKFLCFKCIKYHPENHLESCRNDVQAVVVEKCKEFISFQNQRPKIADHISKRKELLFTLIKRLEERQLELEKKRNEITQSDQQALVSEIVDRNTTLSPDQVEEIFAYLEENQTKEAQFFTIQNEVSSKIESFLEKLEKRSQVKVEEVLPCNNTSTEKMEVENSTVNRADSKFA